MVAHPFPAAENSLQESSAWSNTDPTLGNIWDDGRRWLWYPTPYTLHPTPYTLHPTPYTLHPTPYTLNHDP